MGNFLSDLDRSQEAVRLVSQHFTLAGYKVRELEKAEQKMGDLEVVLLGNKTYVEVKFDIMSKRTGNLCFEMSNSKKLTGIMETQADKIFYVVPQDGCKMLFVFTPDKLREYINTSPKVKIKSGGDKNKFILALVKISDILADKLQDEVFTIRD